MKLYDGTGNILSLNGTELGAEKANALDNMFRECAYKRYDYIPEKYNEFKKVFNIADTFYITNDLQNINTSNNSESVRYG